MRASLFWLRRGNSWKVPLFYPNICSNVNCQKADQTMYAFARLMENRRVYRLPARPTLTTRNLVTGLGEIPGGGAFQMIEGAESRLEVRYASVQ
jgi:hypothetical protein